MQATAQCERQLEAACCDLVDEMVRRAGSTRLRVSGLSMLPAIWPGDVLTVERHCRENLEPGHIVLYRRKRKLTAHRIIAVAAAYLLTRGDSVPSPDAPVEWGEVVGRVVGISRNGRSIEMRRSLWQRAAAWILSRSERCTRLLPRSRAALQRLAPSSPSGFTRARDNISHFPLNAG